MKKCFVVVLMFLFVCGISLYSQEMDSMYGIKEYDFSKEIDVYNSLYSKDGFYTKLKSLFENKINFKDLESYFNFTDDDTLFGTCYRDSLLLYIGYDKNLEMIKSLETMKNKNDTLLYILESRKNMKKLINTSFNFSTVPKRYDIPFEKISIILSSANWKVTKNDGDGYFMNAGEDSYAGGLLIRKFEIENSIDDFFENNYFAKYKPVLLVKPIADKTKAEDSMIYLDSDKSRLIAKDVILSYNDSLSENVSSKADYVYESITVSPVEYNFQIYVGRTRYYIFDKKCIVLQIYSYIAGNHVLADRVRLVKK